ncbi:MAG TPA: isoleucine--tRNA ligase [Candidatus Binataceae bacterium]|nr:isoleucine--tRNA ligase [Candidatus Binataceae bacterium]
MATDYKATLKLPKTDFPMKANLPKREPEMLKRWEDLKIYQRLLETRATAELWVLHDGPPYANGRVHFGTALNKTLKDFIVRSRAVLGYRTPFVPGWDCHGMPIEHNVARELGERARTISKLELRQLCRTHAEKYIDIQRVDFRRLGAIGDWDNPYVTLAPEYEAAEIAVLRRMVEGGYIYRGLRPVHWCIECRTALAEAEVEYRDHRSPSIYVAFRFNEKLRDAAALAAESADGATLDAAHRAGKLFAVIWTTTPWTLPANLGITLNETFEYVALRLGESWYVVADRLASAVEQACGVKAAGRIALKREALKMLDGQDVFRHPFAARDSRLMFGPHVTAESGTGLVHTAPGHGYEDFVIGNAYGLPTLTPVDDGGTFTGEAGIYAGRRVFEANPAVVADLKASGALLHGEDLSHSYPHCWRCKNPLIFRATEQWFLRVDHNDLRARALAEIDRVNWVPGWSRDRIRNMVETRPDWCLSRQRAWGVPIPALRCAGCGVVTLNVEVMKRVEEIFAREGSDAWYRRPVEDFLVAGLKCEKCGAGTFSKEEDVLDVWFDSGCSQAAVLRQRGLEWPAAAYCEGIDQARGWFQSSLICAVATEGHAPYRNVISHGLALDELGRKMSKSLGNFEHAADAVNRIGADVFRLVFASVDYAADMSVGENLFSAVAESYRKLRNTARYMLGNLYDFDPDRDALAPDAMPDIDRFILSRLAAVKERVAKAYHAFDFQAAYFALLNFVIGDLSSLYIDVARDRLYCSGANSRLRRSAQSALHTVVYELVRMLAPLIPYTADEIYGSIPNREFDSVHLEQLGGAILYAPDGYFETRWEWHLKLRDDVLKLLEEMRQAEVIGAPLEAAVSLVWTAAEPETVGLEPPEERWPEMLQELFVVSSVEFMSGDSAENLRRVADRRETFTADGWFGRLSQMGPQLYILGRKAPGLKCQRCWKYYDDGGHTELCPRCRAVVAGLSA